jgi:hypothetical protein
MSAVVPVILATGSTGPSKALQRKSPQTTAGKTRMSPDLAFGEYSSVDATLRMMFDQLGKAQDQIYEYEILAKKRVLTPDELRLLALAILIIDRNELRLKSMQILSSN